MSPIKIKICGITNTEDAKMSLQLGADYLGLIFAKSRRRVDIATARAIRRAEPRAIIVGVFKDAPLDEVVETTRAVKFDITQLHGSESPDYAGQVLARTGRPVIKAFSTSNLPDVREMSRYRTVGYFLFDIEKETMDNPPDEKNIHRMWDIVERKRRKGFRIMLAGALDKDNVREAVRRTNAFGVDVCRGVERAPGLKDPVAVEQFIAEARR
jgi:phosphoribosylanthranilate isomerase